jgi:hypothetical protein
VLDTFIGGEKKWPCPKICRMFLGRAVSPGQKKWQPILGIEFPCNQWEIAWWSEGSSLFFLVGWGRVFFPKLCFVWRVECEQFAYGKLTVQVFSPKKFPIAPHFYAIRFAQSSTLIYINWKGRPCGAHFFLVWKWGSKEVLLSGHAQCSKKIDDGPINMAPLKKEKFVSAPMNHNRYLQFIMGVQHRYPYS